jgi:Cu+-exporting ATPase
MGGDTSSTVIGQLKVRMPTLAGDTFDLGGNIGTKPVVIFHLGADTSWDASARLVQKTADSNPDIVFAATLCDTGKKSLKHARSLNLSLPVMLDPDGKQFHFCQQNTCTPAAVFVSATGDIVLQASDVTEETMKQGLDAIASAVQTRDPVCGMTIDKATAYGSYQYKGNTYYFCSANCENLFKKNPEKYIKQ